jgi:hypothetical protein
MNEKLIKIIGDYIADSKPALHHGLLTGNAGTCIFMYELSRKTGDNKYEQKADGLLDIMYNSKGNIQSIPDFGNGLAGFGWFLEYLIKNGFCNDSDGDVFEDIDAGIYRALHEDKKTGIDLLSGLSGYLLYLTGRLQGKTGNTGDDDTQMNMELFKLLIHRIDAAAPEFFPFMTKDIFFDLLWSYPVLFLILKEALALNIYSEKIRDMIEQWLFYLSSCLPGIHSHRLYMALALNEVNKNLCMSEIDRQIKIMLYATDFDKLKYEVDPDRLSIRTGWMGQALLLKKASETFNCQYPNYAAVEKTRIEIVKACNDRYEKKIFESLNKPDDNKKPDLGLSGLAGAGLLYLLYPEVCKI